MGTASLVIGIITIIFSVIPICNYLMLFPALLGIVLGFIDIAIKARQRLPKSESICGVTLNGLAIFIIAAWTVAIALLIAASGEQIQRWQFIAQEQLARLQRQHSAYVSDLEYAAPGAMDEEE